MKLNIYFSIIVVVLTILGCTTKENPPLKTNSENLKTTVIAPYIEHEIEKGNNIIYCSTFQLAWNELKDTIVKDDILLEGELSLVGYLNKESASKQDISDADYVSMAGFAKDSIVEKINAALRNKFEEQAPVVNVTFSNPEDIFIYSYLYKNLNFINDFESLKTSLDFDTHGSTTKVKAFGINKYTKKKHFEMGKQVEILYYDRGQYDLIIRLIPQSTKDEIILAKIVPENTLLKTIEKVKKMISSSDLKSSSLHEDDKLYIPKINFDITHSNAQLHNKFLLNKGFELHYIRNAQQDILFKLDEKGAVLKSESKLSVFFKKASLGRRLFFDKPFMIYLKERDAKYPYFAMWVSNTELMVDAN